MDGRIFQTVHSHEIGNNALRSLHMLNASLDKLRDVLAATNVQIEGQPASGLSSSNVGLGSARGEK